jgi:hypothetical protein
MGQQEKTAVIEDIEYLEKAFKKWTPNMLSSPYIPTPSVLVKGPNFVDSTPSTNKPKQVPTTKPSSFKSTKKYEEVLTYLHKGSYAYSIGDYGTAIFCFTRLLENEWLKHSTYFYLVKTLIKLDIEKEILSLRTKSSSNNIRITKK